MKKIFGVWILIAAILIGGCTDKESVRHDNSSSQENKVVVQSKNPSREKKILDLQFNGNGKGISVSSNSCSSSISNGQAQLVFKVPSGFELRGDFEISGQIFIRLNCNGNVLFDETLSGSQSKSFPSATGNCTMNISDLNSAQGRIVLRLAPVD